jgi:D-glycero-alpha-D-manno-heptose 1-phosphate guanylyltransferase
MKEAIILAGGFGTRLKHIVSDVPKPMASVNGEPFLSYIFRKLQIAGVEHIILSTGYLHEKIEKYYGKSFENICLSYSQETTPLGTGGAILFGLQKAVTNQLLVLNGDTLFDINFEDFSSFHTSKQSVLSVALRYVENVSRYGAVKTDTDSRIIAFAEKNKVQGEGLINGGIYLVNRNWLMGLKLPEQFSFEKEILETLYKTETFYGLGFGAYFIDIGIPQDYFRAQEELKNFNV